jgi:hypothetical protein
MTLLPHVWIQPTGLQTDTGPRVYAGQVMTGDGRQGLIRFTDSEGKHSWRHIPVRLAPYTAAGLQALAVQLRADIDLIEGKPPSEQRSQDVRR